ncbi:hypothetical protein PYW07_006721 [Mythimna separata]|uniref:Mos1 transposase HTH domain-containing protein n=1 Tax=Mythimna separata TaxID=271217 RepID=A0AAD7YVB4_MYTSE|nr:hypothetical protein PYW07_006721 [Mythimna separata]
MADSREQRAAVKFCFLLGKTGTETLEMLKTAYKDDAIGKTQVFEWFSRFKNGEMSIDDKPRSGRPATARTDENVKKIREIILEDRRRTIEEIVELSGVTWSSVQRILTEDLGMRRVAAKFVPRLLTAEQKQRRVEACFALKEEFKNDSDFFSKVITAVQEALNKSEERTTLINKVKVTVGYFKRSAQAWEKLKKYQVQAGKTVKRPLQNITVCDRVCRPCWLRTQREARHGNVVDYTRSVSSSSNPDQEESQEDDQPSRSMDH